MGQQQQQQARADRPPPPLENRAANVSNPPSLQTLPPPMPPPPPPSPRVRSSVRRARRLKTQAGGGRGKHLFLLLPLLSYTNAHTQYTHVCGRPYAYVRSSGGGGNPNQQQQAPPYTACDLWSDIHRQSDTQQLRGGSQMTLKAELADVAPENDPNQSKNSPAYYE